MLRVSRGLEEIRLEDLIELLESPLMDPAVVSAIHNFDVINLISKAETLMAGGRVDCAIDLYAIWLSNSQSPLAYAIYFNMGNYLCAANRPQEAKVAYLKSLAGNPDFGPSRANLDKLNRCTNFGVSWINMEFDFECEIHHRFPRTGGSATAFKVLNIFTEPSPWCISSVDVRKVARYFDLILTYREELLDLPNAKFLLFGGSNVTVKPSVKRFEVSMLYSIGSDNDMSGYALRRRVWEIRKNLSPLFKYYSSAHRPPVDNDNPWPYTTKNELFESMFSLVIENSSERNYFTEKIIEAFQTYTVPIYWGCPNIADHFDANGIIYFNDVSDLTRLIETLTVDDYYDRLESISANYARSCEYLDLLSRIKREIISAYNAGDQLITDHNGGIKYNPASNYSDLMGLEITNIPF